MIKTMHVYEEKQMSYIEFYVQWAILSIITSRQNPGSLYNTFQGRNKIVNQTKHSIYKSFILSLSCEHRFVVRIPYRLVLVTTAAPPP